MPRLLSVVVAVVLLTAVISCGGGNRVRSPATLSPTPLATVFPPRPDDQLTICVDTVEATRSFQAEAVDRIRSAMVQVTKHSNYGYRYASEKEPVIDSGCPAPPVLYDPAAYDGASPGSLLALVGRRVDTPGYYAKAVFVIADAEMRRYLQGYGLRVVSEEFVWVEGDVLATTTDGLYVSPVELGDMPFLVDTIEKYLGLEEPSDSIEPGYHPDPLPWR